MYTIVDRLVELLGQPEAVLSPFRVGMVRPTLAGDLPVIACSVIVTSLAGRGIGRFIGSKHLPSRMTKRIEVGASASDAFTANLRTLRLEPPIRRNPTRTARTLTEADLAVANVTDAANPVPYRMVAAPAAPSEYRADLLTASVIFGAPQRAGDTLEVTWWTMEWHDPSESDLMRGTIALELWTSDSTSVGALSRRVQDRLALRGAARELGFARLEPGRLEAATGGSFPSFSGGTFAAWTQRLDYGFTFEGGVGGDVSEGGIIRRIDATLDGHIDEALSIPAT
jgi:hypothetical protein